MFRRPRHQLVMQIMQILKAYGSCITRCLQSALLLLQSDASHFRKCVTEMDFSDTERLVDGLQVLSLNLLSVKQEETA